MLYPPAFKEELCEADLSEADLSRANLKGVDFSKVNLSGADLSEAILTEANLREAYLAGAYLSEADLSGADLSGAILVKADLGRANLNMKYFVKALYSELFIGANISEAVHKIWRREKHLDGACLREANLSGANLSGADLSMTTLIKTDLKRANLTGCSIYGIAAWDVDLEGAKQSNLVITDTNEPTITVDNLKVAQFIYLLLNNKEIRDVIDTITSKVVLILGRFTYERKSVLDALRDELRKQNYLPVLFDFEKPANRDLTETVSTLAHLARFIIVDLTDPSSAPHEVATVIPQTVVPVQPLLTLQPLIVDGKVVERHEYAMFEDLRRRYHWVLPTFSYQDTTDLLASLKEHIIEPAEQKVQELAKRYVTNILTSPLIACAKLFVFPVSIFLMMS